MYMEYLKRDRKNRRKILGKMDLESIVGTVLVVAFIISLLTLVFLLISRQVDRWSIQTCEYYNDCEQVNK